MLGLSESEILRLRKAEVKPDVVVDVDAMENFQALEDQLTQLPKKRRNLKFFYCIFIFVS